MATYYVSTTGNDGDPGSKAEPWATLQHAADTAVANDTVIFEDGTYSLGGGDDFDTNSGSAGNLITFRASNEHLAILEYDASANLKWDINGRSYLYFQDLVIDGGQGTATSMIQLQGTCDHITFDNCIIRETQGHGLRALSGGTYSNITIQDCVINPNSAPDAARNGINIQATASNITIDGCTVYETDHTGISIDGDTVVVSNNTVYAVESHGIQVNGGDGIIVRDNVLYGQDGWGDETDNPTGMAYGIYVQADGTNVENLEIYRNIIYNTSNNGIYLYGSTLVGPVYIWNNTLYDNNQYSSYNDNGAIRIAGVTATPHPTIEIYNNIFHTVSYRCAKFEGVASNLDNTDMDYNLLFATNIGGQEIQYDGDPNTPFATFADWQNDNARGWDQNSVIQDNPNFSDKAAGNFILLAGSPAINVGTDVGLSYNGVAPDIGALETDYGTVPDVPTLVAILA